MTLSQELQDFVSLLENRREWLTGRFSGYAADNFSGQILTSGENSDLTVNEINKTLIQTIKTCGFTIPDQPGHDIFMDDPAAGFGMQKAKELKAAGLTLNAFMTLVRYYRQTYIDLYNQGSPGDPLHDKYIFYTHSFFDRIELGYISEWIAGNPGLPSNYILEADRDMFSDKNKYLTVFECLYTPLILLDESDCVQNFNLKAAQLFENLKTGYNLFTEDAFPSTNLKILGEKTRKIINSGDEVSVFDSEIDTQSGRKYFKVIVRKFLNIDNQYKGAILMLEDLTESHQTEEKLKESKLHAEEADRLKTSFLANMSHEIRTPMNAIIGFAELLLGGNYKNSEERNFLKLIHSSSKDLLHIIEDILDIAKLESKQLKIKYKACKIYGIFTNLYAIFSDTLRRYGTDGDIELVLKVDEKDRNQAIFTDGERLKQILSNFLSNSAKFTSKGFIEFGYKILDDSAILFFVRDSGTGIPESMKEKVFDRFFQVEEHQSLNPGGAGLGLAICRDLVNLMGGKIWVESTLGKGSGFYFQIPCQITVAESKKIHSLPRMRKQVAAINLKGKCILIAEDDEISYMLLRETLLRTEASILWARDGLEAINFAESMEKLDLILMDIKMPGVNGFEASKYISTIRPEIPIIAQTAFALDGDRSKCLEAGCCAYITKPVNQDTLFLLIERYILSGSISHRTLIGTK
jgi:signal transduction histidine kinase/CheY-like chemotaxis protein